MDRVHDRVHAFTCFFLRKAMIILFLQGPRLIFNRLNIWAQHELNHSMSDKSITFFLLHKTIPLKSYHIIYINQSIYLSSIYLLILSSFYRIHPFFRSLNFSPSFPFSLTHILLFDRFHFCCSSLYTPYGHHRHRDRWKEMSISSLTATVLE